MIDKTPKHIKMYFLGSDSDKSYTVIAIKKYRETQTIGIT
jgi:hypothetical protein